MRTDPDAPLSWKRAFFPSLVGILLLGGCTTGGGAVGPSGYGDGYYSPYAYHTAGAENGSTYYGPSAYHAAPKASVPNFSAIQHDTSGPTANISANHGSVKEKGKAGGHR